MLLSCTKTTTETIINDVVQIGSLRGNVQVFNLYNINPHNDSVLVVIEGTHYSALTDTNGNWQIDSLSTGTYSISFSKPGYSTWKNTSYSFIGGGIVPFLYGVSLYLTQIPHFPIFLDGITIPRLNSYDSASIYGHVTITSGYGKERIFIVSSKSKNDLGTNPRVALSPLLNTMIRETFQYPDANTFQVRYDGFSRFFDGFNSGDTIYIRAYPNMNQHDYVGYYYFDVQSRKYVVTGCGEGSNILTAVVL